MTDPTLATGRRWRLFQSFAGYRPRWIGRDVMAALTVWAILVPESLAYATIAGVSPVVGLYAAPPALLAYAVLGTSRQLVTATMSATAALSAATVADLAVDSGSFVALTAALAIVVGLAGVLAGLLRLGFLASFISLPVLRGFIVGIVAMIIIGQFPQLFGVPGSSGDFFRRSWDFVTQLPGTDWFTLAIGASSLAAVLVLRHVSKRIPGMLIVVVISIAATEWFDLTSKGVAVVGEIPAGLPAVGLPDVAPTGYVDLIAPAIGILLVGFAEGLAAAKTYADPERDAIDPDRELMAVGAANLGAGLAAGMVVDGSLSKTAVNATAGSRTQGSNVIVAGLTVLTLLFLTGLFEQLPEATLAAVVIAAVVQLVDVQGFLTFYGFTSAAEGRRYGLAARPDFIAAMAAMFGVLLFGILTGLFIGMVVSVLLIVYRSSRPHVAVLGRSADRSRWVDSHRHAGTSQEPGVVVLRPESGLFYANADNVRTAILRHVAPDTRAVILDAEAVPEIDVTALQMLEQLSTHLGTRGVHLLFAREVGEVRDLLLRAGVTDLAAGLYPTVESAVDAVAADAGDQPQ
jgi:sulfate permease, SulP family